MTQNPWETYAREGFQNLERFTGIVRRAYWTESQEYDAIQLNLVVDVEQVEAPPEASNVKSTTLWYSIGKKGQWQLTGTVVHNDKNEPVGAIELWNPDDQAGFVKTTKFWQLVDRMVELGQSSWLARGRPQQAEIWIGLRTVWQAEKLEYGGRLESTEITLPVQVLPTTSMVGAPGGAASAAVAPPAAVNSSVPPPPMLSQAPPPPVVSEVAPAPLGVAPPTPEPPDYEARFGKGWLKYVASIAKGKPKAAAASECFRDSNIQGQTPIIEALNDVNFPLLQWLEVKGWLEEQGGMYQQGPTYATA